MSDTGESGKFSTDISAEIIEEALRSVKKHTGAPDEQAAAEDPTSEDITDSEGVEIDTQVPDPASDQRVKELTEQLALSQSKGREMMERIKDSHEKMLRAVADLENYKKRATKEREEVGKYGAERMLKDLLPVVDNLDRALSHAAGATDFESLKAGVAMTRKLFEDTLAKHGVKSFTSVGTPFDPRFHEAMQQVESADVPPNQVVGEVVRGFTLHDRLVRPALVMVSKAPVAAPQVKEAPEAAEPSGAPQDEKEP